MSDRRKPITPLGRFIEDLNILLHMQTPRFSEVEAAEVERKQAMMPPKRDNTEWCK